MYYRIAFVEDTQAQYFDNPIVRVLVLTNNSKVVHQVYQYKYLGLLHTLSLSGFL